jgi:hypothetical protein
MGTRLTSTVAALAAALARTGRFARATEIVRISSASRVCVSGVSTACKTTGRPELIVVVLVR